MFSFLSVVGATSDCSWLGWLLMFAVGIAGISLHCSLLGRITLLQHVGFLWYVGRISCESGSCHLPRIALSLTCHKLNCGQPPKREIFLLRPFPEVLAQRCCRSLIQRWFHGHWVACLYLAKAAVQKKTFLNAMFGFQTIVWELEERPLSLTCFFSSDKVSIQFPHKYAYL